MNLIDQVRVFLSDPATLWENELTFSLTNAAWVNLRKIGFLKVEDYCIKACILNGLVIPPDTIEIRDTTLKIEMPDDSLTEFYSTHGLVPLSVTETTDKNTIKSVIDALGTLAIIQPIAVFINDIVKTVQIIKPAHDETDISYSHPDIPFSIFITICKEHSLRSNLRVAESILHEAMHLKLTLIEAIVPLVKPFIGNVYFSPWRDKKRPAKGVLHGLFVFRALLDYFSAIKDYPEVQQELTYIERRIRQIETDLSQLKDFANCPDLTIDGATLTKNLLPLN